MAGLLLYFPRERCEHDIRKLFAEHGLAELLDERDDLPLVCEQLFDEGPDGGRGQMTYWDMPGRDDQLPTPITIRKDRQEWRPAPKRGALAAGRCWVGWYRDRQPTPQNLERKILRDGVPTRLSDGALWIVPLLRQLPQVLGFDDAGEVVGQFRVERYRQVFEQTQQLLDAMRESQRQAGDAELVTFSIREHYEYAAQLLAINYRVNADILHALGTVGTEELASLPVIAGGYLQKKSGGGSNSGGGG